MTLGRTSHGTLLAWQSTPGGAFTTIAEVGDLALPALSRNEHEALSQDKRIDAYILGVLRRGAFTFPVNLLPANAGHDHLTGLYKHMIDNTLTGYRITVPADTPSGDAGVVWIMSGQIQNIEGTAPVDGKLGANITLRFSGTMSIGGVAVGA